MQTLLHVCKSPSLLNSSLPLNTGYNSPLHCKCFKSSSFRLFPSIGYFNVLSFSKHFQLWRSSHISLCSPNDSFDDFSSTQLPEKPQNDRNQENDELELLNKPSPLAIDNELEVVEESSKESIKDEALAPFLKFFKPKDSPEDNINGEEDELSVIEGESDVSNEDKEVKKVIVDYYEPKPGDFVVGVVVSGNENKLDVNIGADLLGTMLTKEVLPLYAKEMEYLLCDMEKDAEAFMVRGKMGIVKDEAAISGAPGPGRPVVETGTVLYAEVLGRTLSGRPLLSTRRFFRRIAWNRVRQIKELNEPIEVKITEWNTGGLLTRIEGLRAFLPKAELMSRVNNFKELKENEMLNLREGTLLEGTVKKIFSYGAQVRIGETNRSGLVHISNITRNRVSSVNDILKVDEKVKVVVTKSMFPSKISLSIADLESEPGLFLTNKEKVYAEAEEMANKYRKRLPARKSPSPPTNTIGFESEATIYANWEWFKFERD
ncbi:protein PIGMENT DEFECTIVE 338, chloroplastic isoform X2 [Euphorbia lathyris]|uniref:protein PIGMENT DEFECTIVE 338, chloroplastic isoform X2 n=1 Tax=Euphorbia lathyris TaxID=212925 RepID=UPI0033131E78